MKYALCWNHEMWGVYSANGGFWTVLKPGRYISNGVNATCGFTVEENCKVTKITFFRQL